MMESQYEPLYREMISDIDRCMALDLPETESMENAFRIAERYCKRLMRESAKGEIKNEETEIAFFRNVKPHFSCYMQYFAMLSEAQQFVPADKKLQLKFWNDEAYRYIRFCKKNAVFINYYRSDDRHLDRIYFLMANNKWHDSFPASPFDIDKGCSTLHEGILRSYLAHLMYWNYCCKKLEMLKTKQGE